MLLPKPRFYIAYDIAQLVNQTCSGVLEEGQASRFRASEEASKI